MAGLARRIAGAGLLALGMAFGGAEAAEAQASLLGPGAGFFGGGLSGIATGKLDERLAARGYPTFGSTARAVGIGVYRILTGGVMLGAEWHGLIMGEEEHEGREVGLGGGYATLGVGYAVELSPRARVYPRLGIGGGGLGLWIQSRTDTVAFDEVLEDPRPAPNLRQPVLSRDGVVVDLGAGAEFLPGGRGGPLIGVRLGYLAAPFSSGWDLFERAASGGPEATISGLYARVVVGGAWRR